MGYPRRDFLGQHATGKRFASVSITARKDNIRERMKSEAGGYDGVKDSGSDETNFIISRLRSVS